MYIKYTKVIWLSSVFISGLHGNFLMNAHKPVRARRDNRRSNRVRSIIPHSVGIQPHQQEVLWVYSTPEPTQDMDYNYTLSKIESKPTFA